MRLKIFNNMLKIICITGQDGVGKNTVINALSDKYPSAVVANIWDIMEGGVETVPFKSKADVDNYLCSLTPDSRCLFLAHALKFSIDSAMSSKSELVILNAYYYKYFATELALGASETLCNGLIKSFPVPDLVIKLELDISSSLERKDQLSKYECGAQSTSKNNFLVFQKVALKKWEHFNQDNWEVVSTNVSKDEVLEKVNQIINKRLL